MSIVYCPLHADQRAGRDYYAALHDVDQESHPNCVQEYHRMVHEDPTLIESGAMCERDDEASNPPVNEQYYRSCVYNAVKDTHKGAQEAHIAQNKGREYYSTLKKEIVAESADYPFHSKQDIDQPDKHVNKQYYVSSVHDAMQRHWAVPLSFYADFVNKGFNNCGDKVDLATALLGTIPTIKDIYLLSQLAFDNKIRIDENVDPQPFQRPGGSVLGFGNFRSDQYIALIADTQVRIDADMREYGVNVSALYKMGNRSTRGAVHVGFTLPLKSRLHDMDISFVGGELFSFGTLSVDNFSETPFSQFAKDFIDMYDFFVRAILEPKGLTFHAHQRATGVGDLSLFSFVEWGEKFSRVVASLQTGVNLVVPTAKKADADVVWEPLLGNGGAFQLEAYVYALFNTSSEMFNPSLRAVVQVSAPFTSKIRIPTLKTETTKMLVIDSDQILHDPTEFQSYYVDPFESYDVTVPWFADDATATRTRLGSQVLIGADNNIRNIWGRDIELRVLYNYIKKWKDSVCVNQDGTYNTTLLEDFTDSQQHILGFVLQCRPRDTITIDLSTQNVIFGKNTPVLHEVAVTLAFSF